MKANPTRQAKRSFPEGRAAFGQAKVGALGLGTLAVKRGRIGRLSIDDLEVGRLRVKELVVEQEQTQRRGTSTQPS